MSQQNIANEPIENKKKVAWNKGKKATVKKLNYTNGTVNIKVTEGSIPPEGFYRGQVRHISQEEFDKNKKIQVEKTRETKIKKYGSTSYNNKEKRDQTNLEKYGNKNYVETIEFREKSKATCLQKYGVDRAMKSSDIQKIYKDSLLNKYGVINISQTHSHKDKVKEAWESKSDKELQEILDKRIATNIVRYDTDFYQKTDECKNKIAQTNLERYGAEYFVLTDNFRQNFKSQNSKPNLFFESLLKENNIDFTREFVIERKAYDFKIDNVLIEINPSITHNSTFGIFNKSGLDKNYHNDKSQLAKDNGFRCIHVWDWDDPNTIIELLKPKSSIQGRKCKVNIITNEEAENFINKYHLQKYVKADINVALTYNNEVVAVMTFGKPRYNKNYSYELIRYCTSCNITGGAQKLFTYFIREYNPDSIISYCDLSKFNGQTYEKLNFKLLRKSIGRHWFNLKTKQHITDNLLRQKGFDKLLGAKYGCYGKGSSNDELMKANDFVEVYDAGQATYIWKKSN